MVTTRSGKGQTKTDNFTTEERTCKDKNAAQQSKPSSPPKANTSRKRKSKSNEDEATEENLQAKRVKSTQKSPAPRDESSNIIINRAPVLQLWAACVTHFTHPQIEWETCLSVGSAISNICAVAKGRTIGTIPDELESEGKPKLHDPPKKQVKSPDIIESMHFQLRLKDGRALVSSRDARGQPGSEESLKRKFGKEQYAKTREAFDDALRAWEGDEHELNKKAFAFYERFRPNVRSGQKGWGEKAALNMDKFRHVVAR